MLFQYESIPPTDVNRNPVKKILRLNTIQKSLKITSQRLRKSQTTGYASHSLWAYNAH